MTQKTLFQSSTRAIRYLTVAMPRLNITIQNYKKMYQAIGILTEVETVNNFEKFKKDLRKVSLAYFFTEVIGKITHERERNDCIFELILDYLKKLQFETSLRSLRLRFVSELLAITGFWPKEKILLNPDEKLEEVIERNINSIRVGRKVLK